MTLREPLLTDSMPFSPPYRRHSAGQAGFPSARGEGINHILHAAKAFLKYPATKNSASVTGRAENEKTKQLIILILCYGFATLCLL